MKEAFGEFGGRVRKPLRTGGGVLCIGADILAETAMKWPLPNRMAMARTEQVFWFPAPLPATTQELSPAGSDVPPAPPTTLEDTGGSPPLAPKDGEVLPPPPAPAPTVGEGNGDPAPPPAPEAPPAGAVDGAAGVVENGATDAKEVAKVELPPIDPETAERDELRAWLIAAGDEPAPALGTDKLRKRVRERLAALTPKKTEEA